MSILPYTKTLWSTYVLVPEQRIHLKNVSYNNKHSKYIKVYTHQHWDVITCSNNDWMNAQINKCLNEQTTEWMKAHYQKVNVCRWCCCVGRNSKRGPCRINTHVSLWADAQIRDVRRVELADGSEPGEKRVTSAVSSQWGARLFIRNGATMHSAQGAQEGITDAECVYKA